MENNHAAIRLTTEPEVGVEVHSHVNDMSIADLPYSQLRISLRNISPAAVAGIRFEIKTPAGLVLDVASQPDNWWTLSDQTSKGVCQHLASGIRCDLTTFSKNGYLEVLFRLAHAAMTAAGSGEPAAESAVYLVTATATSPAGEYNKTDNQVTIRICEEECPPPSRTFLSMVRKMWAVLDD